jgi:hypothetical protein
VNVRDLGIIGDGVSDCAGAINRALHLHRALYFPMGRYLLGDTIEAGPGNVLIGLHPDATKFVLSDSCPLFGDASRPRAMIATEAGESAIVRGLGFDCASGNPGAVGVLWRSGAASLLEDIWFEWGAHETREKGAGSLYGLWVFGGGGIIRNLWSANVLAARGIRIEATQVPAEMTLVSVEHHKEAELEISDAENWRFVALQTEENFGSEAAYAVILRGCRAIEFDNLFIYRVGSITATHPTAFALDSSREVMIRGVHNFSWGTCPFESLGLEGEGEKGIREAALMQAPRGNARTAGHD